MIPSSPTQALAEFGAGLRYEALPESTLRQARLCLLDALACALVGSTRRVGHLLAAYVRLVGGTPEAALIGAGGQSSAESAALLNGATIRSLELDDTHAASGMHAGSVVAPAALAAAELSSATGKDLLVALVAGYEVGLRVGGAMMPSVARRGFHPTGVCGVLGAAVAAGRLLGLDSDGLRLAIGSAATSAAGLFQFEAEGGESFMSSALNAGRAAAAGVSGARLARLGFQASRIALEGERGFARAFGEEVNLDRLTEGLADSFQIEQLDFTPYACCRHSRSPVEATLDLTRADRLPWNQVESLEVYTYSAATSGACQRDRLFNEFDALLSVSYAVAVALREGEVTPAQFTPEQLEDPQLQALRRRILVMADEALDPLYPQRSPARVTVRTTDGRRLERQVDHPKGSRGNPFTDSEWQRKFTALAQEALSGAEVEEALELVLNVEREPSLERLGRLLQGKWRVKSEE